MPYPAGHRATTRRKIVDSARKLFNRRGFDNVSVKQIMAGAGMTHGAFYQYFKGKSALYSEVLSCFLTDPDWQPRWEGVSVDLGAADVGSQIIRAYLSRQHFEDVENSCPMVALPTDVRRNGGDAVTCQSGKSASSMPRAGFSSPRHSETGYEERLLRWALVSSRSTPIRPRKAFF